MDNTSSVKTLCYHCGDECNQNTIKIAEKNFCCHGCKMVYEILSQNELCDYYALNQNPGISQKTEVRKGKFDYLNNNEIEQKLISFRDEKQTNITFYLPQIHCSSCLWLLENVHKINKGILSARVNFAKKEVFLIFDHNKTSLKEVVESLTGIGYEPHISLNNIEVNVGNRLNKNRIIKIGIAGFCFGNIMILSFPDYFSFVSRWEDEFGFVFNFLKIFLSLPIVFYCASEFFTTAWKGLKARFLNIDAPIALAIAITFGRSIWDIFLQTGSGYFDSLAGLVFCMLIGRAVQDLTYQAVAFDRDYKSFFPLAVDRQQESKFVPTEISNIRANDIIKIHTGELIPADGILSQGKAEIDYSFVTGESLSVPVNMGEIIYAGGRQLGTNIELLVVKEVSQSYLTSLWNKDIFKNKDTETPLIQKISRYFSYVVFAIAAIASTYWLLQHRNDLMWNALTTILIVACPCALLLTSTFTNGNILRILSKNKFYLRHPDVIEHISKINHIVFDKTGTLTQNKKMRVNYHGKEIPYRILQAIASLLSQSTHPLSNAIYKSLPNSDKKIIENFKNVPGYGIEAWVDDQHIKVGSAEYTGARKDTREHSSVFVKVDTEIYGEFLVQNAYRYGFEMMMDDLKNEYDISVLSGDNEAEKPYLQSLLGAESELLFNQKPADKLEYIAYLQEAKRKSVMMIGDGLNDAGALKQSQVGIAITEGNNNFTPASDAIIDSSQFSNIQNFLKFTASGKTIILISFLLSILYNIVGLYFAVQGILSPVIAAILMPASSVTIVLVTYGLSELAGKRYGLLVPAKKH